MPEPVDALTPERAAAIADILAERWSKDWNLVMNGICERTGLSRQDALLYYASNALSRIGELLEKLQPTNHQNCKACQEAREFHETQYEFMKRHLEEMHGDDDGEWKGE